MNELNEDELPTKKNKKLEMSDEECARLLVMLLSKRDIDNSTKQQEKLSEDHQTISVSYVKSKKNNKKESSDVQQVINYNNIQQNINIIVPNKKDIVKTKRKYNINNRTYTGNKPNKSMKSCKENFCRNTLAIFGYPEDNVASYCKKHAFEGMIIKTDRIDICKTDNCGTFAYFGYVGDNKRFCSKHKEKYMIHEMDMGFDDE